MVGNDLTQGKVSKTLLRFTLPYFCGTFLHTIYSIVDMFIVGQFASAADMAAVSIGSVSMMAANMCVSGFGTGATVLTGQMYGAKQEKNIKETISTVFCFLPLLAILLMVLGLIFRHALLGALHTPDESYAAAEAYVRICLYGLFFTGFYNAIASILRGMGDSTGPTIFVSCACVLNIVGDYICVKILGMGAGGAALATTIAQGFSVVLGLIYLKRRTFPFDFKPKSFHIYWDKFRMILRIGTPTACQEMLTSVSFLFIESFINKLGFSAAAAAGVADRVFAVFNIPALSFSSATAAMVAQNYGAGRSDRAHQSMRISVLISTAVGFVLMFAMWFFPGKIISIFTQEPDVIRSGTQYLSFYKFDMLFFAPAVCLMGYINGIGRTRYTMFLNLISALAVRLPLVWFVSSLAGVTLRQIGIALPSASVVQLLLSLGFMLCYKGERDYRNNKTLIS